jgi:hypothetical protein
MPNSQGSPHVVRMKRDRLDIAERLAGGVTAAETRFRTPEIACLRG